MLIEGKEVAGDWIPMRMDLADDPAVVTIAAALEMDELSVIGRLHKLWCWANRHLEDGHARGVTDLWIDRFLHADGFASALRRAGWLKGEGERIAIPNFDRWNSQGAKRRLLASQRKAKERSRSERDRIVTKTRPEKRREEKRVEDPPTPQSATLAKTFTPPTLEDVRAYCVERRNTVDPEAWMNHYTANGWMVGRTKMKDWRAAVRTWERNNLNGKSRGPRSSTDYARDTLLDAVMQ